MNWIQTYTGKAVDLLKPTVDQISLKDIIHSLHMKCRYSGHTTSFYSVAVHSCFVHDWIDAKYEDPTLSLIALFHDASESYLGDIPGPLKKYLPEYKSIENLFDETIASYIGVNSMKDHRVKEADVRILMDEKDLYLTKNTEREWDLNVEPLFEHDEFVRMNKLIHENGVNGVLSGFRTRCIVTLDKIKNKNTAQENLLSEARNMLTF